MHERFKAVLPARGSDPYEVMKPGMITRHVSAFSLAVLALLATSVSARAQFEAETRDVTKRGTAAAEFLSIPVGARATAMGNAYSASVDDATAMYWNPAGLTGITGVSLAAEYAEWLVGIDFNYVALVVPTRAGTFGLAITSLQAPDMEVTTVEEQNGTGETFDAASYAVAASYARALTDRFSLGGTAKLVTERIWHSSASSFALDVGTTFVTPFRGIRLGASISNFGSKLRIGGDDLSTIVDIDPNSGGNNDAIRARLQTDRFDLPLIMRIGLAGEVFQGQGSRLTLAVDALSPSNSEQYVNVGTELGLLGDLIMLRAGYSELFLDDSIRSFTLGGGLRYRFGSLAFAVDYAYEDQQYFDGVNRFTLAIEL